MSQPESTGNIDNSVEEVQTALQTMPIDFRSALDEFRDNWQRELNTDNTSAADNDTNQHENEESTDVEGEFRSEAEQLQMKAENLFRRAVELEQRGKVYDALPLYRKAVQIVPDIEFKYYEQQKLKIISTNVVDAQKLAQKVLQADENLTVNENKDIQLDEEEITVDLYEKFRNELTQGAEYNGKLLLSNRDASVISTELHISDLPPEIIMYILRWVVSNQLDMRSLEQCAAVCKGMYLCARDDEIWRLACTKVWGHNVGTLDSPREKREEQNQTPYHTWRSMFLERERVLFSGCYISKTTYLRMGENSFQDQYYRPVQLVEYYRYVRFLPDGKALMMTNADEPAQGVIKLKQMQNLRPDVLRGYYRLFGNTVTMVLQKQQQQTHNYARQRRGSVMNASEEASCTQYVIDFRIVHSPKRRFAQLVWLHYSIVQKRNKVETSSDFDIIPNKYPPFWFSPVRSYHLNADVPLA